MSEPLVPVAEPAPKPPRPKPAIPFIVVAVLGLVSGAAFYRGVRGAPTAPAPSDSALVASAVAPSAPVPTFLPKPMASVALDPAAAAALRQQAFAECDAQQWNECLVHIQRASKLDPAGDKDPRVEAARLAALGAVLAKNKKP
jgi:hypothetical protein